MKQLTIKSLLATLATTLLLASCNVETSDNGPLDGFWHLERVDTLATGGTTDYSSGYVFWGVQKDLSTSRTVPTAALAPTICASTKLTTVSTSLRYTSTMVMRTIPTTSRVATSPLKLSTTICANLASTPCPSTSRRKRSTATA